MALVVVVLPLQAPPVVVAMVIEGRGNWHWILVLDVPGSSGMKYSTRLSPGLIASGMHFAERKHGLVCGFLMRSGMFPPKGMICSLTCPTRSFLTRLLMRMSRLPSRLPSQLPSRLPTRFKAFLLYDPDHLHQGLLLELPRDG